MPIYEIKITLMARVVSGSPEQAAADALSKVFLGKDRPTVLRNTVVISHKDVGPSSDEILEVGRKEREEST